MHLVYTVAILLVRVWCPWCDREMDNDSYFCQTPSIWRALVGNTIVDPLDVIGVQVHV